MLLLSRFTCYHLLSYKKMLQHVRSRSQPTHLVLAAWLTTLAYILCFSRGRIRYHWGSRIGDVDTISPQGIVVQSTPREMAANNTLGVSPTTYQVENSLYNAMMILQFTVIVPEVTCIVHRSQLAFARTKSGSK